MSESKSHRTRARKWAWEQNVPADQKIVLLAIAKTGSEMTRGLAELTGLDPADFDAALVALESCGLLTALNRQLYDEPVTGERKQETAA